MTSTTAASRGGLNVTAADLEVFADQIDVQRAAAIYKEHGCLVVRGLLKPYAAALRQHVDEVVAETLAVIDQAQKCNEGWSTPNGSLLLPAPEGWQRDKQIMCLPINYRNSSEFFRSALDKTTLDIVEAILGPDIELFLEGQSLVKEPLGGHPKLLHQDAAYFEHRFEGPVAVLGYLVDTTLTNGALHVIPGSHRWGLLKHQDTFSHLGLDPREWTWDKALPIEGRAGDAIFFHVKCVHGSPENHAKENRPVVINRYRRADDYIIISATTTENRALNEKRVAEAKKENQLGLMVRGYRRFDAGRVR